MVRAGGLVVERGCVGRCWSTTREAAAWPGLAASSGKRQRRHVEKVVGVAGGTQQPAADQSSLAPSRRYRAARSLGRSLREKKQVRRVVPK